MKQLAANRLRVCALMGDDTVRCWGGLGNELSGLSQVTEADRWVVPTALGGLPKAREISAGMWSTCAISYDSEAYCWGARNDSTSLSSGDNLPLWDAIADAEELKKLDLGGKVIQVAPGAGFVCALLEGNRVKCRGANQVGQLGRGTTGDSSDAWESVPGINDAFRITAGVYTACAQLRSAPKMAMSGGDQPSGAACWGDSSAWQIHKPFETYMGGGHYPTTKTSVPVPSAEVLSLPMRIRQLEAGRGYSMVLVGKTYSDEPNEAYWWGSIGLHNKSGPERFGDSGWGFAPAMRAIGETTSVSIAELYASALRPDGTIFVWGEDNNAGVFGTGVSSYRCGDPLNEGGAACLEPQQVPGIDDAVQVVTGFHFACALHRTGSVSCWGSNDFGQMGNGTTDSTFHSPTKVPFE